MNSVASICTMNKDLQREDAEEPKNISEIPFCISEIQKTPF
jgi:hypothetical protein